MKTIPTFTTAPIGSECKCRDCFHTRLQYTLYSPVRLSLLHFLFRRNFFALTCLSRDGSDVANSYKIFLMQISHNHELLKYRLCKRIRSYDDGVLIPMGPIKIDIVPCFSESF